MTLNRVLFAAGGVLVGLMLASMIGVEAQVSRFMMRSAA